MPLLRWGVLLEPLEEEVLLLAEMLLRLVGRVRQMATPLSQEATAVLLRAQRVIYKTFSPLTTSANHRPHEDRGHDARPVTYLPGMSQVTSLYVCFSALLYYLLYFAGFNDATESVPAITTYGRLYFYNELFTSITRETGQTNVSATQIAAV